MVRKEKDSRSQALQPKRPEFSLDGNRMSLSGSWLTRTVGEVDAALRGITVPKGQGGLVADCGSITNFDTAGAWMLVRLEQRCAEAGTDFSVENMNPSHQVLFEEVRAAVLDDEGTMAREREGFFAHPMENIGKTTIAFWHDVRMSMHILGAAVRGSQMKLGHRNTISLAPIANQIDVMGVRAIPIVVLMSTIIGAIIAQQGAFQLRYFGAEIFVVDLVGILVLREIGVLLTAIMIAGRSGSAITAEIGSMKMREEVDALTVIGLNPIGVLIFPRLVALVICLPLLTFIADLAALGGAIFVAQTYSGISPDAFIARMRDAIDLSTFYAGIIKAPFMAIIIGIIASVEGLKVGGSAESLGRHVTSSVVKAIFVVIVVDGLFAMFFAAVDF